MVFVANKAELDRHIQTLIQMATRGMMVWLAYPKAKQLDTDLNRDIIWTYMCTFGFDAVRQVAIDDMWSALRFKLL
ncbi:MAG: hypothetical protein JWP06_376 [Candidatus Saccharibacteria bacterium]|nr:hypothetical protein [Candidatus Saccharibacteria bacterium]